eukprot:scaffold155848_cov19-Tisochrysis_lutea.AAC.1
MAQGVRGCGCREKERSITDHKQTRVAKVVLKASPHWPTANSIRPPSKQQVNSAPTLHTAHPPTYYAGPIAQHPPFTQHLPTLNAGPKAQHPPTMQRLQFSIHPSH